MTWRRPIGFCKHCEGIVFIQPSTPAFGKDYLLRCDRCRTKDVVFDDDNYPDWIKLKGKSKIK